jgi:hypothetical protein
MGAAAAMALADSLTQLQHLGLWDCELQLGSVEGMVCLQAIGRLSQLTSLDLTNNPGLPQQGWMQLTGLLRLKELHVGRHRPGNTDLEDVLQASGQHCGGSSSSNTWAARHALMAPAAPAAGCSLISDVRVDLWHRSWQANWLAGWLVVVEFLAEGAVQLVQSLNKL